jgi:oxygen-dependent protoporphyrinogen oxidase
VLLEARERVGGVIRTETLEGTMVEAGPDSFLAREPHARALCEELGLGDELVEPVSFGAHVWRRGRLRPIPPGFVLGVPARPAAMLRSRLLSPWGMARALGDLVLPGPLEGPDVSVGTLVRRRFGREVLERLVDPILAGTRAGSAEDMSLAAAAPPIDKAARARRSVLLGLRAQADREPRPPFLGLRGGMEGLVERLRDDIAGRGVEIRTGAEVRRLSAADDGGYDLGAGLRPDGVVIALPPPAASVVLAPVAPGAVAELRGIEHASIATVNLLYPPAAGPLPPKGSGILVPSSEGRTIAGCTWTSRKWPHLAPPDGGLSIRCFVGRAGDDPGLALDDGALVERCASELRAALGLNGAPTASRVTRWPRALPQYAVGHIERIDRIEAALARLPALALAGAGYRGSGLPECMRQGEEAARRVLAALPEALARRNASLGS